MKKLIVVMFAMLAMILSAAAYADDNFKVGIVDVRQVLQNSPQVTAIQKKLSQEFANRNKQLQSAQAQLQADAEKLNRDSSVMSASERDALTKKVQAEQNNLNNMRISFQKDLYTKQTGAMQGIMNKMQDAVAKIAKAQNLNLVMAKDAVVYAANDMDITSQVMSVMK